MLSALLIDIKCLE